MRGVATVCGAAPVHEERHLMTNFSAAEIWNAPQLTGSVLCPVQYFPVVLAMKATSPERQKRRLERQNVTECPRRIYHLSESETVRVRQRERQRVSERESERQRE